MAGTRNGSQSLDDASPGPSRRSGRSRGTAANSPSIAPLPSGSQAQGSPAQDSLPAIPEDSVTQQHANQMAVDGEPSVQHTLSAGAPTPMRSNNTVNTANRRMSFNTGGTPGTRPGVHIRGDLAHHVPRPRGRQVPALSGDVAPVDEDAMPDNTFIWGTRISASAMTEATMRFFTTFVDRGGAADTAEARPKYVQLVVQAVTNGDNIVNVDSADIRSVNRELYTRMVEYPREMLPIFDEVARTLAIEYVPGIDPQQPPYITVRVFNLEAPRTIRDLNPEDIDTLVSVQGMVTRTSPTIPDLKAAHFKCERCGHGQDILNLDGKVQEPEKCAGCGSKFGCALIHNLSSFTNKQMVKMQEKPNDIPEGETPHSVNLYVFDANVDVCRPGDRVTITGTYRAAPIRVNPRLRVLHANFRTFIDVMHVQRDEAGRLFTVAAAREEQVATTPSAQTPGASGISGPTAIPSQSGAAGLGGTQDHYFEPEPELQAAQLGATTHDEVVARAARVQELARDPRLYDRLVASLAPNIYGMEDVKKGLLCQLFGGQGKAFPGGRVRGEINLLLVGDPSVSKSQLLTYMHALAPRGMYTSGKGSSATGLTAYVTRDPETRELVLESGALVMSDRGICCIDEFDKMSDGARAMLHETMEQQTVSVAKSGLVSTLNARTSICACANPIGSRYNPSLTVAENINLPPTLLTRFDLIYLVLDKFEEEADLRLARHLISMYHEGSQGAARPASGVELIPQDLLREYVAYARARCFPRLTTEAADELARVYAGMRADGRAKRVVVATPRQLESLIRLSEAQARMRLSESVDKVHVEEATRLWFTAMSAAAPGENGGVDTDALVTGMTAARRRAAQQLPEELARIISNNSTSSVTSVTELLEGLSHLGVTREQLIVQLRSLSHILTLDERTGIVRARRPLAPSTRVEAVPSTTAAAAAVASA